MTDPTDRPELTEADITMVLDWARNYAGSFQSPAAFNRYSKTIDAVGALAREAQALRKRAERAEATIAEVAKANSEVADVNLRLEERARELEVENLGIAREAEMLVATHTPDEEVADLRARLAAYKGAGRCAHMEKPRVAGEYFLRFPGGRRIEQFDPVMYRGGWRNQAPEHAVWWPLPGPRAEDD